jgi:hypothetical protein
MKSQAIQEFRSNIRGTVQYATSSSVVWESTRLSTMFPLEGRPPGSDRAICHTVNGILQVTFKDKTLFNTTNAVNVYAGLYGEYANISGLIQGTTISGIGSPPTNGFYLQNGVLSFDRWSSFANLAQNIFIRLTFLQAGAPGGATIPIDCTVSGVLIGSDVRM